MCGIVGIYNFKPQPLNEGYVKWCIDCMRHRGPDSANIWSNDKNYITGFARLAIRDRSINANQPMLSCCGNYCITFNGEIYNTGLLKSLLAKHRTHYISKSDTEVLLYALIHLGAKKTLEAADGIFAFAFYDVANNKLILARDRMGVKPLYAGISNDAIVYSSQYDHIINHVAFQSESLNAPAIASFLCLGYIPENQAAFHNTKLLLHGNYYEIENNKVSRYQYYNYPLRTSNGAASTLDEVLNCSVKTQLVSDVPLGTFMSGGVDSTLVTYFANRQTQINSFTIGVKDSSMNESALAQEYASIFQTSHNLKFISQHDLLHLISENTKAFTEPFADVSSLPLLMLSRFAKEKITVALSGDGGDEMFWGYPRCVKALENFKYYKTSKKLRRAKLLLNKLTNRFATDISKHWNEADFLSYYYHTLFINGALHWLPKIFKEQPSDVWHYIVLKNSRLNNEGDYLNMARKLEMDIHLQRILLKVDRASMFHSLEVRVPMLSNNMLNFSSNNSYNQCIHDSTGKWNLKQSLISKANKKLVLQPKKGFTIPIDDWMRNEINRDVSEKLLNMPGELAFLFNKSRLEQLVKQHMSAKQHWGWFIWALYSLVNWHAMHIKKYKN